MGLESDAKLTQPPLITSEQIAHSVRELASRISEDANNTPILALIVLKGGVFFGTDLVRQLTVPVSIDFARIRSYQGADRQTSLEWLVNPREPMRDKRVLIIEDIVDTGRTAKALLDFVEAQGPSEVSICTLLDKPVARLVPITPRYIGFSIPDEFVVGFGMDYNERYRNLPDIHILDTGE